MSKNKELIEQMKEDQVKITELIENKKSDIQNNEKAIGSYNGNIKYLYQLIEICKADIEVLQRQYENDNLIIAYIPPDGLK